MVRQRLPLIVAIGGVGVGPTPTPTQTPCVAGLQAPASLVATAVGTNQIRLTWSTQTNAAQYGIVYGIVSKSYIYGAANVGNTSSFTVSALSPNKVYYFAVFTTNACGTSGYSQEASARTFSTQASTTSPSPRIYTTPTPSFVPIDPSLGADEVIPFLNGATESGLAPSPSPLVAPDLVLPSGNETEPKSNPFDSSLLMGILLIIAGIIGGILFLRMKQE